MYNLIEYSDNCLKTSGYLWQLYRYVLALHGNCKIVDFAKNNATRESFNLNEKLTGQTGWNSSKIFEIMVLLKYLSNSWRTLEMPLINCKINLGLNWSENCVIVATDVPNQGATFSITDTKIYVPIVTLSTQHNVKLLEQLKSGFKRTIKWNKYQQKISTERLNQ